jgi:hypothetical protein
MSIKILKDFISKARERGFSDSIIKNALEEKGWPYKKIEEGFLATQPKLKYKNQVCLFLSNDIINVLEKRSRKNMFTLSEQIQDILRRSCMKKSTSLKTDNIDDLLIKCFSRSQKGRKKK